ncbi:unnamed protein product [Adineta steineri]|uniref:Uncharacterized protein n=1 Tax=Adineta steineri TaxID=433720 RepID=A0A814VHU5_9BILA|nr:unnamed protein product [Adineta steineri]
MAILIGNQKNEIEQKINNGSNSNINLGDSALPKIHDTPVQTAFKSANKIIESGTDIITAPAVWLKDMQKNWLSYMVVLAVMLITVCHYIFAMGSIFSIFPRSVKYSAQISGNNNNVWFIDTSKFNITSILDQTIQNATKKFQNIVIANNPGIIINILLILMITSLPILFLYLKRYHRQQLLANINLHRSPFGRSNEHSVSNSTSIPNHVPNSIGGYLT